MKTNIYFFKTKFQFYLLKEKRLKNIILFTKLCKQYITKEEDSAKPKHKHKLD